MILPAQEIRQLCLTHNFIAPWSEETKLNGMTFGISSAGYDIRVKEPIRLGSEYGSKFTLASTIERFQMPNNLLGVVHDKSSLARAGLAVQNTVIEPGWCGYLTLELSYNGNDLIYIEAGSPIAQIIFHKLTQPTDKPYRGKYQDQKSGPQRAILE